jgi:hypothetical protein
MLGAGCSCSVQWQSPIEVRLGGACFWEPSPKCSAAQGTGDSGMAGLCLCSVSLSMCTHTLTHTHTHTHTHKLIFSFSVRIVLMDDAMDCLMSFSDFLFAFQIQFYYSGECSRPHVAPVYRTMSPFPTMLSFPSMCLAQTFLYIFRGIFHCWPLNISNLHC